MTNLYTLSPKIRVVFFHGLNNNAESFKPLRDSFEKLGHETELVILPGHGSVRDEARDFESALKLFEKSMLDLKKTPYVAVAFSQGALFLQLWLQGHQEFRPMRQVLLAPALYIRNQFFVTKTLKCLPENFLIKSFSPKLVQNFSSLYVWEYQILIRGILIYQKDPRPFMMPTLVVVDPQDELVDAKTLKREVEKLDPNQTVEFIRRTKTRKTLGFHHIIFHPYYFKEEDWNHLTRKLSSFLVGV